VNTTLLLSLATQGLVIGSTYALLGVAFQIVYSTTRIFHLAQGLIYTSAAFGASVIVTKVSLPLWAACVIGLATGVIVGILIELGIYRTLRIRKATLLAIFLASLGIATGGTYLMQIIFGPQQQPLTGFPMRQFSLAGGGITLTTLDLAKIGSAWLCVALVYVFLQKSKYGQAILGVSENPNMAGAVGINERQVTLLVMVIGSALASFAALFYAMGASANPQMGTTPTFIGFIAVFFGGITSLPGAALGGFILGMVSSLSGLFVDPNYSSVVMFGVLFLLLIFRPQGLFGQKAR
jgi:branched-chain amino acid transport system permease protein